MFVSQRAAFRWVELGQAQLNIASNDGASLAGDVVCSFAQDSADRERRGMWQQADKAQATQSYPTSSLGRLRRCNHS